MILSGIVKLNIQDLDIYEYDSDSTSKYFLTKSKDSYKPISLMLENDGWVFSEQFGSGFIFRKSTDDKQQLFINSNLFSRYFKLWKVSSSELEDTNVK